MIKGWRYRCEHFPLSVREVWVGGGGAWKEEGGGRGGGRGGGGGRRGEWKGR